MGRVGSGVEVREGSIRLHFTYLGEARKETIKTDGKPMPPTPANVKYAHRLAAEIREKIRHDVFRYADYFPASKSATTGQGATVADRLDVWFDSLVGLEASTLKGYGVAKKWWTAKIGDRPIRALVKSDVLNALAAEPTWTGKTRNNKVAVLKQALQLAIEDKVLDASPIATLGAYEHQRPDPDPFSQEEAEAIIAGLATHYDEQIARYFGAKFYTGTRTSESLAQRWDWLDWRQRQLGVSGAVVLGELKGNTKTNVARQVQLNSRALGFYRDQKAATFLQPHGWIFPDPRTGERFTDDEPPRELWWRPCLKRLGIRYRSPYETRHSYATMMLMAGMAPAFCASQMGHSVEMFLRTYAKWIDGGRNDAEMAKLEAMIAPAGSSLVLPQGSR
jgi:integrase